MIKLHNMIPHFRREKKIKQADMAKSLNVSPSYLCKIEKGIQIPTKKFMEDCSLYLGVTINALFPTGLKNKTDRIKEINSCFKSKLWSIRTERGIKQYEMARILECSPSYLSRVEKGILIPNERFRKRCARILKIKEFELFQ